MTYGSPRVTDDYCGRTVYVVGGANSAGQAAMHLASFSGCQVNMLVRGQSIEEKMSSYLVERISDTPNIQVFTKSEVVSVDGDGRLKELSVQKDGEVVTLPADDLFVLIGVVPKTGWLPDEVARDAGGFVLAGGDVEGEARRAFKEMNGRSPLTHETSMPGLFVAGDVRSGTTKRVASAVGDGATTVPDLHKFVALQS